MPDRRSVGRTIRVAASTCCVVLGAVYLAVCALLWAYEPAFVFDRLTRRSTPPPADLAGFSETTIAGQDGARLYGWWGPPQPGRGAIVLLIGTGVVLSDNAGLIRDLAGHGFGIAGFDYRGVGASTGIPSEAAWRADAGAVFDFVRARAPAAKIAAFGISMGTGLAVELAGDRPVAGILLDSPYASVVRLFELQGVAILPGVPLPARLLMTDTFDSEALIGGVHAPVMILHGTDDRRIPIAEARRLYAAAHQPKSMIEVAGAGHCQVWFGAARDRALAALAAWTSPIPQSSSGFR